MKRQSIFTALLCFVIVIFLISPSILVTESAQQVVILSHCGFVAYNNDYYIIAGEVQNTGSVSVREVNINATLYNAQDEILANVSSVAFLTVMLPGRKAPFVLMWLGGEKALQVVRYTLAAPSYSLHLEDKPQKLEILWSTYSFPSVEGGIINLGDENATAVKIIATFYDENGTVVAANSDLYARIAFDSQQEFEVQYPFLEDDLMARAKSYELTAESREYALKISQEDGTNYYIYIFAAVVAISAISIVAILKTRKKSRRKNLGRRFTKNELENKESVNKT